jgi:hypothetical protein
VDDAGDRVLGEDALEERAVEDGAAVERDAGRHELLMSAGEVVHHHDVDALVAERPHHMRADVARSSGHQPRHGRSS